MNDAADDRSGGVGAPSPVRRSKNGESGEWVTERLCRKGPPRQDPTDSRLDRS